MVQVIEFFFFDPEKIKSIRDKYLESNNVDIDSTNQEELANYIASNLIRVNGYYQSFSKSTRGLQYAASTLDQDGIQIFIELQISGLDLEKFCTKLKNDGLDAMVLNSYFNEYKAEEEVLARFDKVHFIFHK